MARVPGKTVKGTSKKLKSMHRKEIAMVGHSGASLKAFAKKLVGDDKSLADAWRHNKRVNTSKPPLGLDSPKKSDKK